MEDMIDFSKLYVKYHAGGLAQRIGFGRHPAVLVVDLIRGFTDPQFPLGMNLQEELRATQQILRLARTKDVPVVLIKAAYRPDGRDAAHWLTKMPGGRGLVERSPWVEFDPGLETGPSDIVVQKKFASAFFGTNLASILLTEGVDTVLVTGCTTSGCVRATALDAHQHGFRTMVVREAVGDRAAEPHWANLFDLDAKYADVVELPQVLAYLVSLPPQGRHAELGPGGTDLEGRE